MQDGLTKQNIVQAANELRTILATVEELPPETPASRMPEGYQAN
ncbi:MAG TPA: hypothetical protein PK765_06820 [bacterium]|nr:hypothetical protein [bacterium]